MRALIDRSAPPRSGRAGSLPLAIAFGGHPTTLRFLRPADAVGLLEFFESHTPETIHDRYGFLLHLSPERAAQLVGVDQSREAALGVFEQARGDELIAVGRYCLADDGQSAEVAFVVREDRRRLGVATALLRNLVAIARTRGLARLTAQVHTDNGRMLTVFRRAGATFANLPGTGAVETTLDLHASKKPRRGPAPSP